MLKREIMGRSFVIPSIFAKLVLTKYLYRGIIMRNKEIVARAKSYTNRNFWRAVVMAIVVAAIPFLLNIVVGVGGTTLSGLFFGPNQLSTENILSILLRLVSFQGAILLVTWLISSLLAIGEKWAYLEMVDTERLSIQTVFRSFVNRLGRNIWHNILQFILMLFWMMVGILGLILLGFLGSWLLAEYSDGFSSLMVFLGIAFIAISALALLIWSIIIQYWFILSEFILYDSPDISAYQALKGSRSLMKNKKWQLFTLTVRVYLPFILLSIVLPIIMLVLALIIQEPALLIGLLNLLLSLGYFIFAFVIHIRWQGSLAVFYRSFK